MKPENKINCFFILCLMISFVLGCAPSPEPKRNAKSNPSSETSSGKSAAEIENEFLFDAQEKKEIQVTVIKSAESNRKVATFTPAVKRTDGNLYAAALTILTRIYGKERGLIQLEDAKIKPISGGNAVCWQIKNPLQDFCVVPVEVSNSDRRIGAATFWTE